MPEYYRDISVECRVYFNDDGSDLCLEDQASENLESGKFRFNAINFSEGEIEVCGYSPAGPVVSALSGDRV